VCLGVYDIGFGVEGFRSRVSGVGGKVEVVGSRI
jgi:glucose-6-phosphate-specific signal transduction histidine kinase